MRSLFIDTTSFFMSIAIVENDVVLKRIEEQIERDMSSKIIPFIEECFNSVSFELKDIDKLFIVNGPGSFTGVRIGVTVAKVIGWSFNIDVIPLSSLEVLASTSIEEKYRIPVIDARRGYVFSAVYDVNLDNIVEDKYRLLNDLDEYKKEGQFISHDIDNSVKPNIDIIKVINLHKNDKPINPHKLKPNYLKLTEAEENVRNKND